MGGERLSGVLVKRNFNYRVIAPSDLEAHTNLSTSVVTQRQSVSFSAALSLLKYYLHQLSDDVVSVQLKDSKEALRIFNAITIVKDGNMCVLEWDANPVNDMYADAVLAIVLRVDTDPQAKKIAVQRITKPDLQREFRDRLEVMIGSMFGEGAFTPPVPGETPNDDNIVLNIDGL